MSRRQRGTRSPSPSPSPGPAPGGPAAFLLTLGIGLLGILALGFGLIIVAVFWKTAIEEARSWWQVIVAAGVATAISAVGLLLVAGVAWYLGEMATGWLGLFSGQRPEAFGDRRGLGPAAAGSLVLVAVGIAAGAWVYRHGVREDQLNWALMGLFLAGSAVLIGVGGAVPALYFATRGARLPRASLAPDGVIAFLVAAALGVGVASGITMSRAEQRPAPRSRDLKPGRWLKGCVVAPAERRCLDRVEHRLRATSAGWYRVDLRPGCASLKLLGADGQALATGGWPDLRRLGVDPHDGRTETRTVIARLEAGQRARVDVTPSQPRGGRSCIYRLRYTRVAP